LKTDNEMRVGVFEVERNEKWNGDGVANDEKTAGIIYTPHPMGVEMA
jgi:hypothetical protein